MKKNKNVVSFTQEPQETTSYKLTDRLSGHCLHLLGSILLTSAGIKMMGERFPRFGLQINQLLGMIFIMLLGFFIYEIMLPVLESKWPIGKRIFKTVVIIVSVLMMLVILFRITDGQLKNGFDSLKNYLAAYMGLFNSYFLTNFHVEVNSYLPESMTIYTLCIIVIFGGFLCVYLTKKRGIWLFFPSLIAGSELLVGLTPSYNSIVIFLLGLALLQMATLGNTDSENGSHYVGKRLGKQGSFPWILTNMAALVLLVVILGMVPRYFSEKAQEIATDSRSMKDYQAILEEKLQDTIHEIPSVTLPSNREMINNRKPIFTNQTIMTVSADQKPYGHIYLRSFLGTNYKKGSWTYSDDNLMQKAKANGIAEEELQQELQSGLFYLLAKECGGEYDIEDAEGNFFGGDQQLSVMQYQLQYKAGAGDNALMPYFTEWKDEVKYSKDVLPKKSLTHTSYQIWGATANQLTLDDFNRLQALSELKGNDKIWDFYDQYVLDNYLSESEEVPSAYRMARQFNIARDDGTLWGRNRRRLQIASQIHEYLNQYTYSQELDRITDGTDCVEYMLTESKKGYCVHFASAGTLMLRSLGIPARYVGGYVTDSSEFAATGDGYESVIPDSYAHAWTEVYLDHIGWIPIEMTAGYGSTIRELAPEDLQISYTPVDTVPDDDDSDIPFPTEVPEVSPSTAPEATQQPQNTTPAGGTPSPSPAVKVTPAPGDLIIDGDNPPTNIKVDDGLPDHNHGDLEEEELPSEQENSGWNAFLHFIKGLFKVIVFILAIIFLLLMVKFGIQYREHQKRAALAKLMRKKNYGRAVRKVHQEMYKSLQKRGKLWTMTDDAAVGKSLQEAYKDISEAEWAEYMAIVKEAAFSNHELQKGQAEYCLNILQRSKKEVAHGNIRSRKSHN